jgi:hypothetical protein
MAWDEEMVLIVRGLINDFEDPDTGDAPVYSDDRLAQAILIAGQSVQTRVPFPINFVVDVVNGTITPDPTIRGVSRDENFINLTTLKTACMVVGGEIRQYTGQGISIRDGSSAISLSRNPASLKLMKETYCDEYENALYMFVTSGGFASVGEAIVGPVKAWYMGGCGYPDGNDWGGCYNPPRIGREGSGGGPGWWGGGRC